jgi:metal transporter CNNM
MVLVSESPGECRGAIGVVTLEDVIEELIGEEIVDETDVFVDVSRHVRRMNPAAAHNHHQFHRISSRQALHRTPSGDKKGILSRSGTCSTNVPTLGTIKPLNKANEPKPTSSTKVTIKHGAEAKNAPHVATIVSQEERLLGKKAARENYGTIATNSSAALEASHNGDGNEASIIQSSVTLMEERVTVSGDGGNGKVVITPVKSHRDEDDHEGSPLL